MDLPHFRRTSPDLRKTSPDLRKTNPDLSGKGAYTAKSIENMSWGVPYLYIYITNNVTNKEISD
jgi:hypothetical protein